MIDKDYFNPIDVEYAIDNINNNIENHMCINDYYTDDGMNYVTKFLDENGIDEKHKNEYVEVMNKILVKLRG